MAQRGAELTEQQRRCLEYVHQGLTSKEIARQLSTTAGVIDNYILTASQKLGAANRREAARMLAAMQQDVVQRLHVQPEAVAEPQKSTDVEQMPADPETPEPMDRSWAWRTLIWLAHRIGGPRHDLNRLHTLRAILWTALTTSGILAAMITTGYWLNDLFR